MADPSSRIDQALKLVRAIVFPVDGVLNGGRITFDSCGKELCSISVRDAFAIKEALGQGMYVAAVSDRNADGYRPVLEQLGVSDLFFGRPDLLSAYEDFRQARGLGDEECAYIGDDVGDVAVLEKAGFPATPIDGADYLRNRVAYISGFEGGKGCIREIVEMLLARQGKWPYAEEMQEGI